jgi:hypothetical protein
MRASCRAIHSQLYIPNIAVGIIIMDRKESPILALRVMGVFVLCGFILVVLLGLGGITAAWQQAFNRKA